MTGHSVEVTHKLAKQADGTYTSGDYTVRKQVAADCYDPYSDIPTAIRGRSSFLYPAPKPHGWVVEHPSFDYPQWAQTLKDAEVLAERHAHGFWTSRAEDFALAIDQDFDATPIENIVTVVLDGVREYGITMADFIELDERPGQFHISGRGYERGHWHRNLRVTRNDPSNDLFERLKANSTA